jgi:hypothetical protein
MSEAKKPFNPWPWVPVAILLATVLANILLIRLATDTDDVRLHEASTEPVESAG